MLVFRAAAKESNVPTEYIYEKICDLFKEISLKAGLKLWPYQVFVSTAVRQYNTLHY
jgi:hypothetical protein